MRFVRKNNATVNCNHCDTLPNEKKHVYIRRIIRLQRLIFFFLFDTPFTVTRYETQWVLKLECILTAVIKP